ncbi:hypothetical protein P3T23_004532 [Paraburkholderia sp. GAS448]|uniref:hypothetical protein n=1 Tax=Paraburkholderia sp. GAS448 TaxID=3035136 RepID=UPI003D1E2D9C
MTLRKPVALVGRTHDVLSAGDLLDPASIPVSAAAGNTIVVKGDGLYGSPSQPDVGTAVLMTSGGVNGLTLATKQYVCLGDTVSSAFTAPGSTYQVLGSTWNTFRFTRAGVYLLTFYAFLSKAAGPGNAQDAMFSLSLFRLNPPVAGAFNGASVVYPVGLELFGIVNGSCSGTATYPQRVDTASEYALLLGFDSSYPADTVKFGSAPMQFLATVQASGAWFGYTSSSVAGIYGTKLSD